MFRDGAIEKSELDGRQQSYLGQQNDCYIPAEWVPPKPMPKLPRICDPQTKGAWVAGKGVWGF
ncbi:hypothetical protein PATSB16_34980 [Pandoraea thiooxydans]|nr:hypothetical protein PATSB16_34980 [Pandoraea thiooxydans]